MSNNRFFNQIVMIDQSRKVKYDELIVTAILTGFLGVIWETIFVFIFNHHLRIRWLGVLPLAQMYVWGGLIVYVFYHCVITTTKNIPFVFVSSAILLGVFEIVMGYFFKFIGIEMWNYSVLPLCVTPYATVPNFLLWGIFTSVYLMVRPKFEAFLQIFFADSYQTKKIVMVIVILYFVDLALGLVHAYTDPEFMYIMVNP